MVLHKNSIWSAATCLPCCVMVVSSYVETKMEYEGMGVVEWLQLQIMGGVKVDSQWSQGVCRTQLHYRYTNISFPFLVLVRKRLALVLTCFLYCLMIVTDEIVRGNTKYKCVGSYYTLLIAMESGGKCKYDAN